MMLRILSWNIRRREDAWRELRASGADVALLQEAAAPPDDVAVELEVDPAPWRTEGGGKIRAWRTAVVRLSDRVEVRWIEAKPIQQAAPGELGVSQPGTLTVAEVTSPGRPAFLVASLYGAWERPHSESGGHWIFADASVHRLISDLSVFVGGRDRHRILAAGDLNILHGYGDHRNEYWSGRYASVFARMEALGLPFIGPQAPDGRQASPWPDELPQDSGNVPTFYHNRQTPNSATRQLDFVFASADLGPQVRVRALNRPDQWGPSDHCRIIIEVS